MIDRVDTMWVVAEGGGMSRTMTKRKRIISVVALFDLVVEVGYVFGGSSLF